jgi:hypothetical protein
MTEAEAIIKHKDNLIKYKSVANSSIRHHVDRLHDFETSNKTVYGIKDEAMSALKGQPRVYAVYSYGYHFPMYVYDFETGLWLGNSDKYSRTTSKHQTMSCPSQGIHQWFSTEKLKIIIDIGYTQVISQRLEGAYG